MAKHIAASFGQIVTLLMRSPADKAITLQDLEWMVVPAIMTGQFAVADAQSKETGVVMPVARRVVGHCVATRLISDSRPTPTSSFA